METFHKNPLVIAFRVELSRVTECDTTLYLLPSVRALQESVFCSLITVAQSVSHAELLTSKSNI